MPLVRKSSLKHQLSELINDQNQKTQNNPLWKSKTQKIMQHIPQNNHHRNLTQTPTSANPFRIPSTRHNFGVKIYFKYNINKKPAFIWLYQWRLCRIVCSSSNFDDGKLMLLSLGNRRKRFLCFPLLSSIKTKNWKKRYFWMVWLVPVFL